MLCVDQQLMATFADEIIKGLSRQALQAEAKKGIIGVKAAKHKEVIAFLRERITALEMTDSAVKELCDAILGGRY